jgi:hypothetical protein
VSGGVQDEAVWRCPFRIKISNSSGTSQSGFSWTWLALPTSKEDFERALKEIGADRTNRESFLIKNCAASQQTSKAVSSKHTAWR